MLLRPCPSNGTSKGVLKLSHRLISVVYEENCFAFWYMGLHDGLPTVTERHSLVLEEIEFDDLKKADAYMYWARVYVQFRVYVFHENFVALGRCK